MSTIAQYTPNISHPNLPVTRQQSKLLVLGVTTPVCPMAGLGPIYARSVKVYGYKAQNTSTGVFTNNAAPVFAGKSQDGQPDSIAAGGVQEYVANVESKEGIDVASIWVHGGATDGVYMIWEQL